MLSTLDRCFFFFHQFLARQVFFFVASPLLHFVVFLLSDSLVTSSFFFSYVASFLASTSSLHLIPSFLCRFNQRFSSNKNRRENCDNPSHSLGRQLVITRLVGVLLKDVVLGLRNAKRTNNLIMESERTHNKGVGVGALHDCEPGILVSGTGCHKNLVN